MVWTIYIFAYIGNNHPNWLVFFRGVAQPPTSHFAGSPDLIYHVASNKLAAGNHDACGWNPKFPFHFQVVCELNHKYMLFVFIEIHISILISSPLTSTHVWRLYLIHDWFLWIHFGSWWDFPISLGHDVCWNAGYIPMLSWFNYVFADQVSIWSFSNTNFQILVVWILMLAASAWLPIRSFHGLTFTDSRSAI